MPPLYWGDFPLTSREAYMNTVGQARDDEQPDSGDTGQVTLPASGASGGSAVQSSREEAAAPQALQGSSLPGAPGSADISTPLVIDGHTANGGPTPWRGYEPWLPGSDAGALVPPRPAGQANAIPGEQAPPSDLPRVARGADLARVRVRWYWAALCFAITFAVYLLFVPRFVLYSSPPTGDQVYYMMDTISLVQDHDLLLNNNYANQDWQKFYSLAPHPADFVGMSAPDPLPPMLANATARPPQEQYSFHLPGLAVWLIPAWVIGGVFQLWWPACVVFMCLLGALMVLNIFLFAHELTGKPWIAWMVWLPVAFAGPVMTFSLLVFTELPVGLLLIYVFRRLALGWGANGPFRLFLIGLAIANIPWLAWRCAPVAAFLGLYALVQWWRYRRLARDDGETELTVEETAPALNDGSFKWLGLLAAPVVLLGGLLLYYNLYLFGRIIPDSSVLEQGRVAIFHYPWQSPEDATLFVSAIFGQLFDRGFGLLPYAPVYVLSFVGMIAIFRLGGPYRRILLWMALIALPYLAVICSFENWNGVWCPPARYLTTFVPFLAGLLAISLLVFSRSVVYKIIYFLLAIPGWVLTGVMLEDPRVFWPVSQGAPFQKLTEYPNSIVKIDFSQFLPIFSPVNDVTHPVNTAWITAAAVAVVLLCYLLMQNQTWLRAMSLPRLPYGTQGAMWAVTILVVGSGWLFMNYQYLKHHTTVVQVNRWNLIPPLEEAYGITYFNGTLYLSAYNRNTAGFVATFDPATGAYTPIQPQSPDGAQFSHVGDVKPGPDGLLYVLNNGDANHALYIMTPDGHILKELSLGEKTPIATGLSIDRDGKLFIADMLGGRILAYPPGGGAPAGIYGGMAGGFNNPAGVAVTPDGMIYAAEQGYARIQQLGPSGKFIRSYDLHCKPNAVTVSGDYLDIACDTGLVGINWKKQDIQLVRYDAPDHRPDGATGLTYGADNTLYVLAGSSLIEYKITH